eukprot:354518-Chlamydomonas_euryale.AAC.2
MRTSDPCVASQHVRFGPLQAPSMRRLTVYHINCRPRQPRHPPLNLCGCAGILSDWELCFRKCGWLGCGSRGASWASLTLSAVPEV